MANILVLYYTRQFNLRSSQRDHLLSFKRYAKEHNVFYINIFTQSIPAYFKHINFDLVIFSWSLLGNRVDHKGYLNDFKKMELVKQFKCPKIAMPQDEFSNTELLCTTINHFSIDIVYSVSPETEWVKMYRTIDFSKVSFFKVLTGYLEDRTLAKINKAKSKLSERNIDVGFRSGAAAYWGRFNLIKFDLAEKFLEGAKKFGFTTDISFGWENFLLGDQWYDFLLRCKYMPGIEGGSSIIDWDGSLYKQVNSYIKANPTASFNEVEASCIPIGKDGEINVVALSPRHLEACATKTCQVLIEGEYNNVLVPGKHYLCLKKDFSNLEQIFLIIKEDKLRAQIVENAFNDIVLSGKFNYQYLVNYIINNSIGLQKLDELEKRRNTFSNILLTVNKISDSLSWLFVRIFSWGRDFRDYFKKS